jgi:5-methylthioribose kinase
MGRGFYNCDKKGIENMISITKRQYEPLSEITAIQLIKEMNLFEENAELNCREIGDGNLNYVFQINDSITSKSFIIKQALPYAKIIGESWPLTIKRATIEAKVLRKHGEYVPELVPEVYVTDEDLAITIMEDLSHLTVAREGLIQGETYPKLSLDIGKYLARTLFYTSDFALHPFEKKQLVAEFSNPELCKITEDLVFTDPFFNHESNDFESELTDTVNSIWNNQPLKLEAAKLKFSFLTEAQALLHGDLHTGSIFVNDKETKVIDPEFAFYGPIGFDVGQFLANLMVQAIIRTDENRLVILDHISKTWVTFSETFSELWKKDSIDPFALVDGYEQHILKKIFSDTIGFAGCELIRRTIGLAHVKDLDGIEDNEKRIRLKKKTLEIGTTLILNRNDVGSIKEVIALLEKNS